MLKCRRCGTIGADMCQQCLPLSVRSRTPDAAAAFAARIRDISYLPENSRSFDLKPAPAKRRKGGRSRRRRILDLAAALPKDQLDQLLEGLGCT